MRQSFSMPSGRSNGVGMLSVPDRVDRIAELMAQIAALGREQQRAQHLGDYDTSNRRQEQIARLDERIEKIRRGE